MLKNGGDNQIHQPYNLLRIKKAQLSLEILLRRLGLLPTNGSSNQCPPTGGYEPDQLQLLLRRLGSNQ